MKATPNALPLDVEGLREAIATAEECMREGRVGLRDKLQLLIDAAKSTLPKTKMVEVWRLEYAQKGDWGFVASCQSFPVEIDALNEGVKLGRVGHACIRVTGPHLQEVPS